MKDPTFYRRVASALAKETVRKSRLTYSNASGSGTGGVPLDLASPQAAPEGTQEVDPPLIPSLPPSPLPERANPGVGVSQEGDAALRCSRCGGKPTAFWSVLTNADGSDRRFYCSAACVPMLELRR
jgi:hypothetical protein